MDCRTDLQLARRLASTHPRLRTQNRLQRNDGASRAAENRTESARLKIKTASKPESLPAGAERRVVCCARESQISGVVTRSFQRPAPPKPLLFGEGISFALLLIL